MVCLGDHRRRALDRRQRDLLGDEVAHTRVAARTAAAAHDHGHEITSAAVHGGHQIESRRADISGLDAVDAVHLPEQMVVVGNRLAAEGERADGEIFVVAREALLDGAPENGLIARGRDLVVVGKAGGVLVHRALHS